MGYKEEGEKKRDFPKKGWTCESWKKKKKRASTGIVSKKLKRSQNARTGKGGEGYSRKDAIPELEEEGDLTAAGFLAVFIKT